MFHGSKIVGEETKWIEKTQDMLKEFLRIFQTTIAERHEELKIKKLNTEGRMAKYSRLAEGCKKAEFV